MTNFELKDGGFIRKLKISIFVSKSPYSFHAAGKILTSLSGTLLFFVSNRNFVSFSLEIKLSYI